MVNLADRPENRDPLRYLGQVDDPQTVSAGEPPPNVDRWQLGTHPDVVERLWDQLPAGLPGALPYLIEGGPALVDGSTGLILGVGLGTQYGLRLAGDGLAQALAAGYETVHTFRSVGRTLDLGAIFGPGWAFGGWDDREAEWLAESRRAANL